VVRPKEAFTRLSEYLTFVNLSVVLLDGAKQLVGKLLMASACANCGKMFPSGVSIAEVDQRSKYDLSVCGGCYQASLVEGGSTEDPAEKGDRSRQRRRVMADTCADCGKIFKSGLFIAAVDEQCRYDPSICFGCYSARLVDKNIDPAEIERRAQLRQQRQKLEAQADSLSSRGDTPGISIVLYLICGLSIIGGIVLATQGAVIWLFVALIEVAFLLGFIAMINYLFQAKNSLHFIENMLKSQIDQDKGGE
jgi:hypothetical protein